MTATDTTETDVRITGEHAEEFDVRDRGDRIAIIAPQRDRRLLRQGPAVPRSSSWCPVASGLPAKAGSTDVATHGRFGDTRVDTGSGDVSLDVVDGAPSCRPAPATWSPSTSRGDARIKSGSGDVRVGQADAALVVSTGSGDVAIEGAGGELAVKTGSGDAHGPVEARRGRLHHRQRRPDRSTRRRAGRITAKGASGDVRIGVPAGTPVWTDITHRRGRLPSDLERGRARRAAALPRGARHHRSRRRHPPPALTATHHHERSTAMNDSSPRSRLDRPPPHPRARALLAAAPPQRVA